MINIKKIRSKIIIMVLFCSILLAGSLLLLSTSYNAKLINAEAEEKLMNLAIAYAKKVDSEFLEKELIAESIESYVKVTFEIDELENNPNYLMEYKKSIEPFIYRIAEQYGDAWIFFNPFLVNEAHDIWYFDLEKNGIPKRIDEQGLSYYKENEVHTEWFFKPMREKKANWTDPYLSTTISEKVIYWITYGIPIYFDDIFIGVVGTDFIYEDFEKEIKALDVYGSGYGALMNEEYDFLVHPYYEEFSLKTIDNGAYKWMSDYMEERETGVIEYTWIDGSEKVLAFSKLYNGWRIAIVASKNEIYITFINQIFHMIGIIIVGLILMTGVVYYLSSGLTKTLEDLTVRINEIGKGDYEIPIPEKFIKDLSEVGILAVSVEEMRIRQKYSFEKIHEHNINLELLVEKRTKELKETHEVLIETQKFEETNKLLMEIAHRMNTPLGNSKVTISYLQSVVNKMKMSLINKTLTKSKMENNLETIENSLKITLSGVNTSIEIIRNLQKIFSDTKIFKINKVNLLGFLKVTFEHINVGVGDNKRLMWRINCSENIEIETYPMLLVEVLENLVKYSLLYSEIDYYKNPIMVIAKKIEKGIIIDYYDQNNFLSEVETEHIFEPFMFSSFDSGTTGLELYMVYTFVKRGLKGTISYLATETGEHFFRITLPLNSDLYMEEK